MDISPDSTIFWQYGFITLSATIFFTWGIVLLLAGGSWLITRHLTRDLTMSGGQNFLEVIVEQIKEQIEEVGLKQAQEYVPFIGTLFLFIVTSNLLTIIPGYDPPTGSLSTTAALALCVFLAVPFFTIRKRGLKAYLRTYIEPRAFMLPLNIIGELSRTLALAVRLFGNIMSGSVIISIIISVAPLFFPVLLSALGLLTGMVQAYIFAVLATVYIAAAAIPEEDEVMPVPTQPKGE